MISASVSQPINRRRVPRVFLNETQRATIRQLYNEYGSNYTKIAEIMGLAPRKVREHILANIKNVSSKEFTLEEDQILLYCVNQYGHRWSAIAQLIGTKSAMMCRNRFKFIQSRQRMSPTYCAPIIEPPQPKYSPPPVQPEMPSKVLLPSLPSITTLDSHLDSFIDTSKSQSSISFFLRYPEY